MKSIYILLLFAVAFPVALLAQKTIKAESIIADINNHTPVTLNSIEITGDLDLTKLNNMKLEPDYSGSDKKYISTVTSSVSFTNCTFTGKVLGYFNPDERKPYVKSSTVYNTNFTAGVSFEKCIFENDVAFKYSVFDDRVSFSYSHFNNDASFKYASFKQGPNFSGSVFKNAIFKYVDFPEGFDFSEATFEEAADFKYAKFMHEGSFAKTKFKNGADFKYASFSKLVNFKGASFDGTSDLKYTTLDNGKTTLQELINR